VIRGSFAIPHYLIRHPGRSLGIAILVLLIAAIAGMAITYLWATYHLSAARAALERYHTNEALPHLRACMSIWSRDPETLLLAARAARRIGAFDEIDRYLDQYQALRGTDDETLVIERVLVRAERGELDRVGQFCQALVKQDHPATPLILEALSRGYLRKARPRDAEMALKEWLQRQPDNPQALFFQGQMHDLDMRLHDAIASYRRSLAVDPEMDEVRLRLCATLVQRGQADEARPHLEYLIRRFPENLMVQVYLARAHDQMGRSDEADQILVAVLARQPDFGPALTERGKMALRAGRSVEAEKWLRQAVALELGDYQAHYQLVLCLEKNGKSDEAQKVQARLEQIERDISRLQDISRVKMQHTPHDPALHYEAGVIAMRAGAVEGGLRWLHSALEEDPNYKPAHKALMEYYIRIGDFDSAAQHRRKAESGSNDKVK
jgi:tetratricopeptide (TPR) repeat protein